MDEATINIACEEIATSTLDAALSGGVPPARSIFDLPYTGSRTMLNIKNTWITLF